MSASQVEYNQPLEADNSNDSDYSTDPGVQTDTTSITSSIRAYTYANGRRYHSQSSAESRYLLPNDETEQDRLDLTHHSFLLLLSGELFTAPLLDKSRLPPQRILDCGTGTGIWALDVGDLLPGAIVTGVDLSPIQPGWTAPNVKFEVDDLEKDWTWKEDTFDYIHSRSIGAGIKDWGNYVKQMYTHLQPNGLIEIGEHNFNLQCDDGTLTADTHLYNYIYNYFHPACAKMGVKYPEPDDIKQKVIDAGFVDVQLKRYPYPWGPWAKKPELKRIGAVAACIMETGLEAYGMALMTKALGADPAEIRKMAEDTVAEVKSRKVHAYVHIWYIVARKPTAEELAAKA